MALSFAGVGRPTVAQPVTRLVRPSNQPTVAATDGRCSQAVLRPQFNAERGWFLGLRGVPGMFSMKNHAFQ